MHQNIFRIFLITTLIILVTSCNSSKNETIQVSPQFSKYISAFTEGVIPNNSSIIIELKKNINNEELQKLKVGNSNAVNGKILKFEPHISGEAFWVDNRTIEFFPKSLLEPNLLYTGTVNLNQIIDVPNNMSEFKFQFQTKPLNITVNIEKTTPYPNDLRWQQIHGVLSATDNINDYFIDELVSAKQNGKILKINWKKNNTSGEIRYFTIDSVVRSENKENVCTKYHSRPKMTSTPPTTQSPDLCGLHDDKCKLSRNP